MGKIKRSHSRSSYSSDPYLDDAALHNPPPPRTTYTPVEHDFPPRNYYPPHDRSPSPEHHDPSLRPPVAGSGVGPGAGLGAGPSVGPSMIIQLQPPQPPPPEPKPSRRSRRPKINIPPPQPIFPQPAPEAPIHPIPYNNGLTSPFHHKPAPILPEGWIPDANDDDHVSLPPTHEIHPSPLLVNTDLGYGERLQHPVIPDAPLPKTPKHRAGSRPTTPYTPLICPDDDDELSISITPEPSFDPMVPRTPAHYGRPLSIIPELSPESHPPPIPEAPLPNRHSGRSKYSQHYRQESDDRSATISVESGADASSHRPLKRRPSSLTPTSPAPPVVLQEQRPVSPMSLDSVPPPPPRRGRAEREKERERERLREQEWERERERERERDRLREREDRERAKEERERNRQKREVARNKAREERERETQRAIEREYEEARERELESAREREADLARARELEQIRQQELEKTREKERAKERERQRERAERAERRRSYQPAPAVPIVRKPSPQSKLSRGPSPAKQMGPSPGSKDQHARIVEPPVKIVEEPSKPQSNTVATQITSTSQPRDEMRLKKTAPMIEIKSTPGSVPTPMPKPMNAKTLRASTFDPYRAPRIPARPLPEPSAEALRAYISSNQARARTKGVRTGEETTNRRVDAAIGATVAAADAETYDLAGGKRRSKEAELWTQEGRRAAEEQLGREQRRAEGERRIREEQHAEEVQRRESAERREGEERAHYEHDKRERERQEEERRRGWADPAHAPRQPARSDNVVDAWNSYELRWSALSVSSSTRPITFRNIPWPLMRMPTGPESITPQAVGAFLLSPLHSQDKSRRERLRSAVRRWHPSKFEPQWMARIDEEEQPKVKAAVDAVAHALTELVIKPDLY